MRTDFAIDVADANSDDLLTTGEAAKLLGMSRQHIVDLCNAGDLPFTQVGTHRRIRRSDIDLLRTGNRRTTADQRQSLFLAYAIAGQLVTEHERTLRVARTNLKEMTSSSSRGAARVWLAEWSKLLDGPLQTLLAELTSQSPRSRELRQNTPFAGVLSDEDRSQVLATARLTRVGQ